MQVTRDVPARSLEVTQRSLKGHLHPTVNELEKEKDKGDKVPDVTAHLLSSPFR